MLGLYIHFPWCVKKCPYCDFNSHRLQQDSFDEKAYIEALKKDFIQSIPFIQDRLIHTVFLGGGTPSLFSPQAIENLLAFVDQHAVLHHHSEITMEVNPGTIEYHSFFDYKKSGINRISLGVQSFQNDLLKKIGRIHNKGETEKAINKIQQANFNSFNLDIMYALPSQELNQALDDLKTALQYNPPHLSWYQLTLEPNTAFYQKPPKLPHDDLTADIYDQGIDLLKKNNYERYEISAFTQPEHHCQHNLNYWQFGDYIGIGAGAHSKITDADKSIQRIVKPRHPKEYLRQDNFIHSVHSIHFSDIISEFMLNHLRVLSGFSIQAFEQATGLPFSCIKKKIEFLCKQQLLHQQGKYIKATTFGLNYLNEILIHFIKEPIT